MGKPFWRKQRSNLGGSEMVGVTALARFLHCSRQTALRYVRTGMVRAYKRSVPGKETSPCAHWLIPMAEVQRVLERLYQGDKVPRGVLKRLSAASVRNPRGTLTPAGDLPASGKNRYAAVSRYHPHALEDAALLARVATEGAARVRAEREAAAQAAALAGPRGEPQGGGGE